MNSAQSTGTERRRSVRQIVAGGQLSADGIVVSNIGPKASEWLPRVLETVLPESVKAVRKYMAQHRADVLTDKRHTVLTQELQEEILDLGHCDESGTARPWTDAEAEAAHYINDLGEFAVKYQDLDEDDLDDQTQFQQRWYEELRNTLTSIGTGRGRLNAGLEALAKGPTRLHQELDDRPHVLTLVLDGDAWSALDDRSTGVRALAAIAVLGTAFDVRLILSPALETQLERRFPKWYDTHLRLTVPDETSSIGTPSKDDQERATLLEEAWDILKNYPEKSKKLRLLAHLSAEDYRDYRDLKRDDEIGAQAGTVGRYVLDLEDDGLVTIDRRGPHNSAALTRLGDVAVEEFIADDYTLVHPTQSTLETHLTLPPQRPAGTVYSAQSDTSEWDSSTAEDWVAATGNPNEGADYVQWLGGPSEVLDAWGMHRRYLAGCRDRGVSLVDDRIQRFEDGRVTYLSCFEDELLVLLQWGGPLPTLGRIAGALLSDKALSKLLTPSRLGSKFEEIDDSVVKQLDRTAGDILRWGHQIGWFSEDEEDYDSWRERVGAVRSLCLEKVGRLSNSDDVEARTDLFRDLQGLVASATQLYYAAGINVTINPRIPDTAMLVDDEQRLNNFLDFIRYTVPKQSVYGIHSGYRMILENRPEKLKRRLPYDVDVDDPTMHLTASWVISGPAITELRDDVEQAIEREAEEVREAIAEGREAAPTMEIPVMIGNSYSALRELVQEYATAKQYNVAKKGDISSDAKHDLERLVRLCLQVLATEDRPHRACPHDVVEALLHIASSTSTYDFLTVQDLEYGLRQLPATRLLPNLPPSATKLLKVVLASDDPIGRSKIIDEAGISGSSYDRYIMELAVMDVLEERNVDGRRRWVASLEAWWAPEASGEAPEFYVDDDDFMWVFDSPREGDVVSQLLIRFGKLYDNDALVEAWIDAAWPHQEIDRFLNLSSRFRRWWPYIWAAFAGEESLRDGPPNTRAVDDTLVATIGQQPPATDTVQTGLEGATGVVTIPGDSQAGAD